MNQRKAESLGWNRQTLGPAEGGHKRQTGGRNVRQLNDSEASDFDQPGQGRGRACNPIDDVNPVVSDQREAMIEQPQQQVGLAGA